MISKDQVHFYAIGVPNGFDAYPKAIPFTENSSYFEFYYNFSLGGDDEKFFIHRGEGFISYTFLRYHVQAKGGRPGSFIGASIVLEDYYVKDVRKVFEVLKSACTQDNFYKSILQATTTSYEFLIAKFEERKSFIDQWINWTKETFLTGLKEHDLLEPLDNLNSCQANSQCATCSFVETDGKGGSQSNSKVNEEIQEILQNSSYVLVRHRLTKEELKVVKLMPIDLIRSMRIWRSQLQVKLSELGLVDQKTKLNNLIWSRILSDASEKERQARYDKLNEELSTFLLGIRFDGTYKALNDINQEYDNVKENPLWSQCKSDTEILRDGLRSFKESIDAPAPRPIPTPTPKIDPTPNPKDIDNEDIDQRRKWWANSNITSALAVVLLILAVGGGFWFMENSSTAIPTVPDTTKVDPKLIAGYEATKETVKTSATKGQIDKLIQKKGLETKKAKQIAFAKLRDLFLKLQEIQGENFDSNYVNEQLTALLEKYEDCTSKILERSISDFTKEMTNLEQAGLISSEQKSKIYHRYAKNLKRFYKTQLIEKVMALSIYSENGVYHVRGTDPYPAVKQFYSNQSRYYNGKIVKDLGKTKESLKESFKMLNSDLSLDDEFEKAMDHVLPNRKKEAVTIGSSGHVGKAAGAGAKEDPDKKDF